MVNQNSQGFTPQDTPVDLTNCDREPIHIPGRIQSFGALISVSADWMVNHVSLNISAFIKAEPQDMIGTPLRKYVDEDAIKLIRSRLPLLAGVDAVERLFGVTLNESGETFDIAVHMSGRSIIIEIERHVQGKRADYTSYVRPMIERIGKAETSEELCEDAARQLRHLIGFDPGHVATLLLRNHVQALPCRHDHLVVVMASTRLGGESDHTLKGRCAHRRRRVQVLHAMCVSKIPRIFS